jgi:hypothetical protein
LIGLGPAKCLIKALGLLNKDVSPDEKLGFQYKTAEMKGLFALYARAGDRTCDLFVSSFILSHLTVEP